mmetsp:Transcript_8015/g.18634  ORF Transcript_8015/g.18634 Transcript_8015/m.18634 type:complete len:326 (-) Transcript_8015:247-1224(-)
MVYNLHIAGGRRSSALVGGSQQIGIQGKGRNVGSVFGVVDKALGPRRRKVVRHDGTDLDHVLVERIEDGIGTGVVGVRNPGFSRPFVVSVCDTDDLSGHVVHVEDRRVGVGTNRMELVGISHGQLSKGLEVFCEEGFFDGYHALRNNLGDAMRQEGGGCDAGTHSCRRGGILFGIADHHDDGPEFRPVGFVGDLHGHRIAPGRLVVAAPLGGSRPPGDESTVERPAGRTTALSCDGSELALVGFLGVHEFRECGHQRGVSRGARSQSGGRGKGVVARDVDLQVFPLGRIRRQCFDAIDAGPETLALGGSFFFLTVQPQAVLLEFR